MSLDSHTVMRKNFHHLYADVAWFGLLFGSTMAFLSIYAARLGATGLQISFLSAGPAVTNLLFSLPAGTWIEKLPIQKTTFWSAVAHRTGYLLLIPLPWLLTDVLQIWVIIAITLVMAIPGTFLAISFNALLADAVPADYRADLVGRRNALLAVTYMISTLVSGQILENIPFPLNYQLVFGIGALGIVMSNYHLSRIRLTRVQAPPRVGRTMGDQASPGQMRLPYALRIQTGLRFLTRSRERSLLRLDLLKSPYGRFLAAYLLFYIFQFIPIPLFPLVFVEDLRLSDQVISLGNGLFYLIMFLGSLALSRLSSRFSYRQLTILGALFYGLYPLLIGLGQSVGPFLIASVIGGASWSITSGAMINRLMEQAPEGERPAYMAMHNLALNLGILLGALGGPLLGSWIGMQNTLVLDAGLRLLAALMLLRWG